MSKAAIPRSAHGVLRAGAANGWVIQEARGKDRRGEETVYVIRLSRPGSPRADIAAVWHGSGFYAWFTEAVLQPFRKVGDLAARLTYEHGEREA